MTSKLLLRIYLGLFIVFLILPLLVAGGAAFNDTRFPSVWPWRGFTLKWFDALWADDRMWSAFVSTLVLSLGVTALAVPIGTAAAIVLDSTRGRSRGMLYAMMTAPILTPAAVVGLSTLLFWRSASVPAGLMITTLGVASIIAAFVMLLVVARLKSFDKSLEEAALDLGASHGQMLRMILFPHLRPALLLGAAISFLQSLEAYNVPLFTRGNTETIMIFIASKVRTGITPQINALALVMILVAVLAGIFVEVMRRREVRRRRQMESMARKAAAQEEAGLAH